MYNFIYKGAPKIDKFSGRGFAAISYKQNRIVNIYIHSIKLKVDLHRPAVISFVFIENVDDQICCPILSNWLDQCR